MTDKRGHRHRLALESPCTDIPVPVIARAADFIFPVDDQVDALAAGLPADWTATIWLMYGCGLRIGEALAVRTRCRINRTPPCPSGSRSTRSLSSGR